MSATETEQASETDVSQIGDGSWPLHLAGARCEQVLGRHHRGRGRIERHTELEDALIEVVRAQVERSRAASSSRTPVASGRWAFGSWAYQADVGDAVVADCEHAVADRRNRIDR